MTRTVRRRNSSHPTRDGNHKPVCVDPENCNECNDINLPVLLSKNPSITNTKIVKVAKLNVYGTCPRCKKKFLNPWQECDDCITKYYPET